MIENIDLSFEVYTKYPWNQNIPFDDFCELILPYRIDDELLTCLEACVSPKVQSTAIREMREEVKKENPNG